MSAVVAILNKQAVAIAADSAVTVNGKVFNGALKMFTLSKYRPVGIMIYSSASLMNTPWETIIKIYRAELKEQSFHTVQQYVDHFVSFLHTKYFFLSESAQKAYLQSMIQYTCDVILNDSQGHVTANITLEQAIVNYCDSLLNGWMSTAVTCAEFGTYTYDQYLQYLTTETASAIDFTFTQKNITLGQGTIDKLRQVFYQLLIKQETFTSYTGLVFTGFGDQEIFPSLRAVNIHFAVEDKLKFYVTNDAAITHQSGSSIQPFAQTEVMSTILTGIAPNLEDKYIETFRQYSKKIVDLVATIVQPVDPGIAVNLQNIDLEQQVQEFAGQLRDAKTAHYIYPLHNAIANLSKEDLAEMAESLIYLTYLQKRISFALEDVGGAVDVAVISKGDGFIWINRKHYFKPELNQFFFNNYFK